MESVLAELRENAEPQLAEFQANLTPALNKENFLGVRTPYLRDMAKRMSKEKEKKEAFLKELPHKYFEENQLHSFLIALEKDYQVCMEETEKFLPYVDNWATCDQATAKVFAKHKKEVLSHIEEWIKSKETYTIRYAIGVLMKFYLDEDFTPHYLNMVAAVKSEEYYVNMMSAWFFATALAKQWDSTIIVLEEKKLDPWVHNKTIQKARESFRVSEERKEYLKTIKIGL